MLSNYNTCPILGGNYMNYQWINGCHIVGAVSSLLTSKLVTKRFCKTFDLGPHRDPRGELIEQYRPPMSFHYNDTQSVDPFELYHIGTVNKSEFFRSQLWKTKLLRYLLSPQVYTEDCASLLMTKIVPCKWNKVALTVLLCAKYDVVSNFNIYISKSLRQPRIWAHITLFPLKVDVICSQPSLLKFVFIM